MTTTVTAGQEPARPDLRIARLAVSPSPLRDGQPARITLLLFNDSTRAAVGSVEAMVAHDRSASQPSPVAAAVSYLEADALTEIVFELPAAELGGSPYTFYAVVDRSDAIAEDDESNNTAWQRVAVCGAVGEVEQPDGYDNDCDGLIDEELGLPPDTASAVRLLRGLQRQAALDSLPLLFRPAAIFAPLAVERPVRLQAEQGSWIGVRAGSPRRGGRQARGAGRAARRGLGGGGDGPTAMVRADRGPSDPEGLWTMVDWNGGGLASGDTVSLRTPGGEYVVARGCGGGRLEARASYRECERLFTLIAVDGSRAAPVGSGDAVALRASIGPFVAAEQGGGGELRADRAAAGGWETFTLFLEGRQ